MTQYAIVADLQASVIQTSSIPSNFVKFLVALLGWQVELNIFVLCCSSK